MKSTNHRRPPRLPGVILEWFAGPALIEDLRGDLDELHRQNLGRMSPVRANLAYWRQCLSLVFSYGLKQRKKQRALHPSSQNTINLSILSHYGRMAVRSLSRDRFFTTMNVAGLAIGMSFSLLLLAMLAYISRYDTFHEKRDSIFRIVTRTDSPEGTDEWASTPAAIASSLKDQVAGIRSVVRLRSVTDDSVRYGDRALPLHGFYADPGFLEVFTFPLSAGNPRTALTKPNSVLLTEKAAARLFGGENPLGRSLLLAGNELFEVTGILKDHPKHSHLHFEMIVSYATLEKSAHLQRTSEDWEDFSGSYLYVLLENPDRREPVETHLERLARNAYKDQTIKAAFSLQSLNDIVPGPDLRNGAGPSWDLLSMGIFFFLTLLILLPACANYATLSISRALKRMKEIGVRKAIGGRKDQIVTQFAIEAILVTFLALGISFYLFTIIRGEFLNMVVYGQESLDLSADALTFVLFGAFALCVGLLSGILPGLYFARLSPLQALRGRKGDAHHRRISLRKALLVLQFSLSLGFIMSVVIVFSQYRKTLHYDFGFQHANVLDVDLQGVAPDIFRNEVARLQSVQEISMSSQVIGTGAGPGLFLYAPTEKDSLEAWAMSVDSRYIENLGLKLMAGHGLPENPLQAGQSIVVNEAFLRARNIPAPADALGKSFRLPGGKLVNVTGVVKDFHYATLRETIRPFFFYADPEVYRLANIKLRASDPVEALAEIETSWKTFAGDTKFVARFFDDEIEEAYSFYFAMIKICGFLGLLAISISCLGLLGMVVFTVENRVKEIGIRKVMGASTEGIVRLLSWDFIRLLLVAFAVATPLTYLFMDRVYLPLEHSRIPISAGDIVLSMGILLVLGLVTILSQTVRASHTNPVETLRSE